MVNNYFGLWCSNVCNNMSQKRKGVLELGEKRSNLVVIKPSPEVIKGKKPERGNSGLFSTKDLTLMKKSVKPAKRNTAWVSSSFDTFIEKEPTSSKSKFGSGRQTLRSWCTENSADTQARPNISSDGGVLWCEKYSPTSEVELAVHKKKVAEVRDWLLAHLTASKVGCGVLLLTGPPGAGKTATLRVLARELGVEIQEWINPINPLSQNETVESDWRNYNDMVRPESQIKRFRDFFLRANKYPCLSLDASSVSLQKKVVIIEDMPNLFYRSPTELHDLLRSYQRASRNPVVIIVSDSNSNDTNAYRLFPKDVIQTLGISTISFNPASVTSLNKLTNKIISTETQKRHATFQAPSKELIDNLVAGSNGDIRGMINNLQFSCLKGCSGTFQKQKYLKQSRSNRGNKTQSVKGIKPKETEASSLVGIGGKDTSLFLFRVLGKILYCKREENNETKSLPTHLKQCERRLLVENPENVFEKSHMSGDNLTLYLHQNYLDFFNNIEAVSVASSYLSDADFLTAKWTNRSTLSCYTPCLSIRGLMFCNQGNTQNKSGWRPLHKPQWYSVFKQTRNNMATTMDLFKEYRHNAMQLHCEIIPYLAMSDAPLRSPGQIAYLQTTCKFSNNNLPLRNPSSTLQDKEIDDEETDLGSQLDSTQTSNVDGNETVLSKQVEEDDDIQEFDDD